MDENTFILKNEYGEEIAYEALDYFKYKRKEYAILLPVADNTSKAVIFRYGGIADDEEIFDAVIDDRELETVYRRFKRRNRRRFVFQ